MFKGKRLSILGDSISTYKGVSNDASANSTLFYNPFFYKEPFPLEKTYWKRLMDSLGLTLCVNNSRSGGNLSGEAHTESGVNRADNLHKDDGTLPEFIIVFMGINDLGRRVSPSVFSADYEKTLMKLSKRYPNTKVCCVNLPDRDALMKNQTKIFNSAIEDAVRSAGDNFFIADLFHSPLNNDDYYMNTVDGLHPDEDGMRMIAEVILSAINKSCGKGWFILSLEE